MNHVSVPALVWDWALGSEIVSVWGSASECVRGSEWKISRVSVFAGRVSLSIPSSRAIGFGYVLLSSFLFGVCAFLVAGLCFTYYYLLIFSVYPLSNGKWYASSVEKSI